jgi:hypothetical protein
VYFEQLYSIILLLSLFPTPLSNSIWWVSRCYLHMCNILWSSSPRNTFSFPSPLRLLLPESHLFTLMSYHHNYHDCNHHSYQQRQQYFRSIFHLWAKTWYWAFWAWLLSLNMMISKWHNFILLHGYIKLHYAYIVLLHYFPAVGQLGWFHHLAIENSAMIKTGIQRSLLCFGYMPKSGIVGLWPY